MILDAKRIMTYKCIAIYFLCLECPCEFTGSNEGKKYNP